MYALHAVNRIETKSKHSTDCSSFARHWPGIQGTHSTKVKGRRTQRSESCTKLNLSGITVYKQNGIVYNPDPTKHHHDGVPWLVFWLARPWIFGRPNRYFGDKWAQGGFMPCAVLQQVPLVDKYPSSKKSLTKEGVLSRWWDDQGVTNKFIPFN